MSETATSKEKPPAPRPQPAAGWAAWRPVVIPAEHGGWGFMLEPVLLGLLVAPSPAAGLFALATIAAFLLRHPLKLTLADRRRGLRTAAHAACAHGDRRAVGYSRSVLSGRAVAGGTRLPGAAGAGVPVWRSLPLL